MRSFSNKPSKRQWKCCEVLVTAAVHVSCCKALEWILQCRYLLFSLCFFISFVATCFHVQDFSFGKMLQQPKLRLHKYSRNAYLTNSLGCCDRSLMQTSQFWWSLIKMMWWQITLSDDLIRYEQPIQKYVGWEQNWREYWEIIWRSARIDLTPVWDADLACWSCRFRTYLAWAGFCKWARRPHGSWRGGRPQSPAGGIGRPGNAPRRATSRWSVTRGCWAGAVPGNRAEGSLCRETETMRQRGSGESLYAEAVVEALLKHTRLVKRTRRSLFGITLKQALQCFIVSLELNAAA